MAAVAALAVLGAATSALWPASAPGDQSLRDDGSTSLITSDGVTIWLLGLDDQEVAATTSGTYGVLCSSARTVDPGVPLCVPDSGGEEASLVLAPVERGTLGADLVLAEYGRRVPLEVVSARELAQPHHVTSVDWDCAVLHEGQLPGRIGRVEVRATSRDAP